MAWRRHAIAKFCQRHQIRRLALLRDSLTHKSNVDALEEFAPDAKVGLIRLARIEEESSEVLGRPTQLMT